MFFGVQRRRGVGGGELSEQPKQNFNIGHQQPAPAGKKMALRFAWAGSEALLKQVQLDSWGRDAHRSQGVHLGLIVRLSCSVPG